MRVLTFVRIRRPERRLGDRVVVAFVYRSPLPSARKTVVPPAVR